MAPQSALEAVPGRTINWRHHNATAAADGFVELVPDRRIVFTYGWDRPDVGVPFGSTTVEITLHPTPIGTDLHLVHTGLSEDMAGAHQGGWVNYLHRLATVAEGRDPGPDPLAGQRVPAAHPRAAG